jgi:transcriptional regulator with GAF, ATPase, and Fis domain
MTEKEIVDILSHVKLPEDGLAMNDAVDQLKRLLMVAALKKSGGYKARAGDLLRLNRLGIKNRMEKLGLCEFFPPMNHGKPWRPK